MMFVTTKVVIVATIFLCQTNFNFAEVDSEVINEIENDDGEMDTVFPQMVSFLKKFLWKPLNEIR